MPHQRHYPPTCMEPSPYPRLWSLILAVFPCAQLNAPRTIGSRPISFSHLHGAMPPLVWKPNPSPWFSFLTPPLLLPRLDHSHEKEGGTPYRGEEGKTRVSLFKKEGELKRKGGEDRAEALPKRKLETANQGPWSPNPIFYSPSSLLSAPNRMFRI